MRESLAKLETLCLGVTVKDQDWTALVEDTRWAKRGLQVVSTNTAAAVTHQLKLRVETRLRQST